MPKKKSYRKKKRKPIFEQKGYLGLLTGADEKKREALSKQFTESAESGDLIRII
jgi:hypothetical protein